MSVRTDRSNWSPEEGNSLDNIDNEVQMVSTSSDSYTLSNHTKDISSVDNKKIISVSKCEREQEQSTTKFNSCIVQSKNQREENAKLHSSCDDLSMRTGENKPSLETDNNKSSEELAIKPISRSSTFVSLNQNKKVGSQKYDHVQSKIKHYFNNGTSKNELTSKKNGVITELKGTNDKDDYLKEINKQLLKELDEKNAIITLLQENYEHLLFKYAEAQNKLDELRLKFMTTNVNANNHTIPTKLYKSDNQYSFCNIDSQNKEPENKCQKAVVAPFLKSNQESFRAPTINVEPPATRPSSLPLENSLQFLDRSNIIKATTPTDSEGLSSVITSMSGHSKILNSLDEETQINKNSNAIKHQSCNFVLEENFDMNDPFDKVKNWQNSLPPLEQIETPETTLYNVCPNNISVGNIDDKKHKDVSSPKLESDYDYLDESCPPSWREDRIDCYKKETEGSDFHQNCNSFDLSFSLPRNNLSKRNVMCQTYKKAGHHSFDVWPSDEPRYQNNYTNRDESIKDDVSSTTLSNKKKQKRPPLLRCSSLPTYDCSSIKSGHRNGMYIPPLNLSNITLSDDESYCQQHYPLGKSNSSFTTSRTHSVDRSIQTSQSFSSCKMTIDEENYVAKVSTRKHNKSTSITPEKNSTLNILNPLKYNLSGSNSYNYNYAPSPCLKECCEVCRDKSKNWCKVCGEPIAETERELSFRTRSNSCESVHNHENPKKSTATRSRPPFKRSVSFNSEVITSKHKDEPVPFYEAHAHENFENFDVYASNLKARSQAVMKALTAHVNKSPQQS